MKPLAIITTLLVSACTACSCTSADSKKPPAVSFTDVTKAAAITSERSWKYGGPAVADINNDGNYDLLLGNHDQRPTHLFWGRASHVFQRYPNIIASGDVHGLAAGDYDGDGDMDLLVALGGGNGTEPQPPRLLKNNKGHFKDITVKSGIAGMGARGRSVRWQDLDNDGDLDLLQINAAQMVDETGPRNILFENVGHDHFVYRKSPVFEKTDAERVLVTDINADQWPDLISWSPYENLQILLGDGPFTFTDATKTYLPGNLGQLKTITAVANADVDNDGDMDFYLARGKVYYLMANNALEYDKTAKRIDLRDEGNKSHDGLSFTAPGSIQLDNFYFFPRGKRLKKFPLYLGADKTQRDAPASLITVTQAQAKGFPAHTDKTGWYLGYLGNRQWRFEWRLAGDDAWDVRASIIGADTVNPDFTPQKTAVEDVLLINEGDHFRRAKTALPSMSGDNNWGVIPADFNNDGLEDFFIYRFGKLTQRLADVLLLNNGDESFTQLVKKDATTLGLNAHGDMGAAFDYDHDGRVDILSGDDNNGRWHLYRNTTPLGANHHYLLVDVGYSKKGVDAIGARVDVYSDSAHQTRLVNSGSATHSQSVLNLAHFGLGADHRVKTVKVTWRDGTSVSRHHIKADTLVQFGARKP